MPKILYASVHAPKKYNLHPIYLLKHQLYRRFVSFTSPGEFFVEMAEKLNTSKSKEIA
jgi:hypothetical protein